MKLTRTSTGKHTISAELPLFDVKYERRRSGEFMGRFGGGWQWEIGAQLGGRTLILNLLVASIRITRRGHDGHNKETEAGTPCVRQRFAKGLRANATARNRPPRLCAPLVSEQGANMTVDGADLIRAMRQQRERPPAKHSLAIAIACFVVSALLLWALLLRNAC